MTGHPAVSVPRETGAGSKREGGTSVVPWARMERARPRPIHVPGPDGVSIAVHDFGGTGPTLLFAHATGMHGWMWHSVAEHLIGRARCVALDLRGHGDSAFPEPYDFRWAGFGRDVLAAVAAIGADDVIGVGHSMGGAALVLAELAEPGMFRELFLYEPALGIEPDPDALAGQRLMAGIAARRRATFASRADALANYARKAPTAHYQAAVLYDYVEHGFADRPDGADGADEVGLKCRPEIEAGIYEHSHMPGVAERITELKCRLTFAVGGMTDGYHHAAVASLSRAAGGRVVRMDGVDHFGPMRQPAALAREIERHVLG
jgi:pimeloyl-ACP methyl ester carboxylesterase